jgi:IclR family acetate operon transcriptional repressor
VGKVFLAHVGTVPAGPLTAFTDRTIVDHDVLRAEVERVRERCWGQAIGEREEGLNAVAVPVLDPAGELVAILGVQGPAVRFRPRVMRGAVELLMERAGRISLAL